LKGYTGFSPNSICISLYSIELGLRLYWRLLGVVCWGWLGVVLFRGGCWRLVSYECLLGLIGDDCCGWRGSYLYRYLPARFAVFSQIAELGLNLSGS
jgi:hypothetical protein